MNEPQLRHINLPLQGGGAHGAFTWGVLDRLLECGDLPIEGISGTSAGAVNAVVLADGYEADGAAGARVAVRTFWREVSRSGALSPYRSGWWNPYGARYSPMVAGVEWLNRLFSPYQLNPGNLNPLMSLLESQIDFERLRRSRSLRLFVSATNVRTNRLHIFTNRSLSARVIAASCCLPQISQAVEIDGEAFWDGGFMGNPVIDPLLNWCETGDIVVVQVNPRRRESLPRTAADIRDRVNEITFNASLMREIRCIAHITRLLDESGLEGHDYERAYFHLIDGEEVMAGLGLRSKFDTDWGFLRGLRERGRQRADDWLQRHAGEIGSGSTFDLEGWAPPYV